MTLADFLKNIADGIREKEKSAKPIPAAQYASRLKALQTVNDEFDAVLMIHTRADDGNIYGIESYKSLTIVEGAVGSKAFTGYDALENVTIGNGVTAIEEQAFYNCRNLTKVTIGNGVERIGNSAFENCQSLVDITYIGTIAEWEAIEKGGYWNISTGEYTIRCIDGEIGKITVEDAEASRGLELTLNDDGISYSVTGIGTCTDTDVIIPRFYNNKFVTGIGNEAFYGCAALTSVTIGNGVTNIHRSAFRACPSLEHLNIGKDNTVYHSSGNCIIETATKTLVIGCGASVIPADGSVASIGQGAFGQCSALTDITIPNSVISIDSAAFYDCTALASITIPNSVTSLSQHVFWGCSSLANIILGNGITSIEEMTFRNCNSLKSITIPNSVTRIVYNAFYDCYNLLTINAPWSEGTVEGAPWGAYNATINYNYTEE